MPQKSAASAPEKARSNSDKIRLNLDLTPKAKSVLDGLQERTEASTLVEVVRRAIALYDLATTFKEQGGTILLKDADGIRELAIL